MVKIFFSIFQFDLSGYFTEFELSSPKIELGVANFASNFECPNHLNTKLEGNEIRRFLRFFQKFSEISNNKIIYKTWSSQPCSWVLSECYQALRVLPPNMTAQILVVFEIWRFLWFFQNFSENKLLSFFVKSEIPNPVVGYCQSAIKHCESCLQIWLLKSL